MSTKHFTTMATKAQSSLCLHSSHVRLWMNDCSFTQRILNIIIYPPKTKCLHLQCSLVVTGWCPIYNCCHLGATCTSLQCHFIQSHIRRMHACLAVTCHLHFWQNDRDLLHAAAVTWGWNRYSNECRKLALEKNSPAETETCDLLTMCLAL